MNAPRSWPTRARVIAADTTVSDADDAAADRPLRPTRPPAAAASSGSTATANRDGRAVAAPPHRVDRDRTQIGHEHGGELHREPRAPACQRRQPDQAGQQHRRVDGEAELLIGQQSDDAGGDEPEAALGPGAVGRGRVRRAVDPPEVREPAGGRDHGRHHERDHGARRAGPHDEPRQDGRPDHTGQERKADVQPRQRGQDGADAGPRRGDQRPRARSDRARRGRGRPPWPPPRPPDRDRP